MDGDHRLQWTKDWRWAYLQDGETVVNVPCRQCIGCNIGTQREWSIRCFHEAQLHTEFYEEPVTKVTTEIPNNCVVTLTYNDEHLPEDGLLKHDDFQRFMKRLRKRRLARGDKSPVRYFMCGEYGGKTHRPHYHTILFGESFDDRYNHDDEHQSSYELDEIWTQKTDAMAVATNIGIATVDCFSFAGAAYVAGYVAKKHVPGHLGPIRETVQADGTRIFLPIAPEYRKMSTHPGLGAEWILKPENLAAVYENDCVKIAEWTFHPPAYYDTLFQRTYPKLFTDVLANRYNGMSQHAEDWSQQRCASAEIIAFRDLQQRRDSL